VAVVTGANSGLGVGFAVALAHAGADVLLGARRAERLETTADAVRATGRRALSIATDVADPDS
jgi:NADP-dependent 3-hydroxy acid dehydrogenase YdfG